MIFIDDSGVYYKGLKKSEVLIYLMCGIGDIILDFSETSGVSLDCALELVLNHINTVVRSSIILAEHERDKKESAAK